MLPIIILTAVLTLLSFVTDRQKTFKGIKKGIMTVIILVSVVLYFVSNEFIVEYLGKDAGSGAYISSALIGSVSIIPGFIAYPLSGILVKEGVSLSVIAVFITTLKMVGILTIPIEAKFFGIKTTLIRNGLSFIGAIIVGTIMAIILYYI